MAISKRKVNLCTRSPRNFIQLSNDSGWEIQGRRHSDDLLKLFPQQHLFEISQRDGFLHGSVGWVTSQDSLKFQVRSKQNGGSGNSALVPCGVTTNIFGKIQKLRARNVVVRGMKIGNHNETPEGRSH